jgi:hypothetical protein
VEVLEAESTLANKIPFEIVKFGHLVIRGLAVVMSSNNTLYTLSHMHLGIIHFDLQYRINISKTQ